MALAARIGFNSACVAFYHTVGGSAATTDMGIGATSYTEDSILYDIFWVNKNDMPLGISDATASVVNGKVYIIGGCDSEKGNSNVGNETNPFHACTDIADHVLIYNPTNDSWDTSKTKMPLERYRHASVVVGNDIYVIGGRDVSDKILQSVLKYSTVEDAWELVTEFTAATSDNAAFEHAGKVITCGGYNYDYSVGVADCHIMNLSSASPKFTLWETPLAKGRGDFSIVKLGGLVYAYGGFDAYNNAWAALTSLEKIDPAQPGSSSTWITLDATMVHGRGDFAAATVHGRLLAIGGENSSNTMDAGASLRHVEAYNPKTNKWLDPNQLAAIPHATFRFCAAEVNGGVYIFGGQGPYNSDCDCFPTKAAVFVYNENTTMMQDTDVAHQRHLTLTLAALLFLSAVALV